ncbi:MAG: prephenate dehydratase [Gemmatimonadales bacterium]
MSTIAYQGSAGAFSELAARYHCRAARTLACADFAAVIAAVTAGRADLGVIPVRNSTIGAIAAGDAALAAAAAVRAIGEFEFRVCLCLIALPGAGLDTLRRVESHPVALAQCRGFLARHGLTGEPSDDTAESARRIALDRNFTRAAVASAIAAERHGLRIVCHDIADVRDNRTTFVLIGPALDRAA